MTNLNAEIEMLKKKIEVMNLRAAYIEGATEGKFGLDLVDATIKARKKYPMPDEGKGEDWSPEVAEAMRVPQAESKGEYIEVSESIIF